MRARTAARRAVQSSDAHSSIVGGSTAKLRRACPKSIDEEAKVPKEPSGYAADRGTALHHVCEMAFKNNWGDERVLQEFAGVHLCLNGMEHTVELTADLLRAKALPALAFLDATLHLDAEFWLEKKMPFPGIEGSKGTADIVFDQSWMQESTQFKAEAGIIDYKFGDGWIIEADDNDQMRFYLVCAIAEGLLPENLPEYSAYIFQPAEKLSPDKYASRGVYSKADLDAFTVDLVDAIQDWREGTARHVTGEHCKLCRGRIACEPFKQMLTTAISSDVRGMNTADLAAWMRRIPALKQFMGDVYAAALRNAQAGHDVPGYKLEAALGNSAWIDEQSAAGALGRLGVANDVRVVKSIISPTQALAELVKIATPADKIERFKKTHIMRPNNGERLTERKADEPDGGAMKRMAQALKARGH